MVDGPRVVAALGPEHDLSTDQLLAVARQEVAERRPWCPNLVALHDRPTRYVFEKALALTHSSDSVDRELGVRLLRELGPVPRKDAPSPRTFYAEAAPRLLAMLDAESDGRMLGAVISAIGYQYEEVLIPSVLKFKEHEDPKVRFYVASAIGRMLDEPPDPRGIGALIDLAADSDVEVRYEAFTTLLDEGVSIDKQLVRDAVLARIDDPDDQIRQIAREYPATS